MRMLCLGHVSYLKLAHVSWGYLIHWRVRGTSIKVNSDEGLAYIECWTSEGNWISSCSAQDFVWGRKLEKEVRRQGCITVSTWCSYKGPSFYLPRSSASAYHKFLRSSLIGWQLNFDRRGTRGKISFWWHRSAKLCNSHTRIDLTIKEHLSPLSQRQGISNSLTRIVAISIKSLLFHLNVFSK